MLNVSIAAEKLFSIFGFPVTNALFTTILISLFIIILGIAVRVTLKSIPGRFQAFIETIIEGAYGFVEGISPTHAREIFPLVMTFLIFIVCSNWFGLLPGITGVGLTHAETATEEHVDTVSSEEASSVVLPDETEISSGEHSATEPAFEQTQETDTSESTETEEKEEFIHLFRPGTADLNTTIALALVSVVSIQLFGMQHLGIRKYLSKFFTLKSPIDFFVGLLELVSEFGKIVSFSFRLFGNVFAGEVLMAVIGMLIPLVVPIPFFLLELFVGFIQGVVFFMLTLVFMEMATQHH